MVYPVEAEVHILQNEQASREYMLQMWAEIMVLYRSGQYSMKFSKEIQNQLVETQKEFMPEDTEAGMIMEYLDSYKGKQVCTKLLYKEALHQYDEPKRWKLHNIGEIMNTVVKGWKYFENPRSFGLEYGRQRGWEREDSDNEPPDNEDGFCPVTEETACQMEIPKEWLK